MQSPLPWFVAVALGVGTLLPHSMEAAQTSEDLWREVLRLDAGPPPPPVPPAGAANPPLMQPLRERYSNHLVAQEKALRAYLTRSGDELHAFEARFRLARVLSWRGIMEENPGLQTQSASLLDALEKIASNEQRAHIAFTRISQKMRVNRLPNKEQRAQYLTDTRAFLKQFPTDPRGARLLVEVATQCDREPELKRSLLNEASSLTKETELHLRIADDLKKLSLLGKKLPLDFPTPEGAQFSVSKLEGAPSVILFFSEDSIPSLVAMDALNEALRPYPKIQKIAFSLDRDKSALERVRKTSVLGWTLCWDGIGWEGPIARGYGINAAPTAWLLDSSGRLLSLNVLEELAKQLAAAAAQAGIDR